MSKTIVLFHTKLHTLNVFSNQMQEEFEELGYDIFLFDMENSMQSLGELYAYMQKHIIIAMIGFNSTLFGLKTEGGSNVWETLNIPCINILVDHPYWYRDILINTPRNGAVLCVDFNHMNFVSRFYPNIAVCGFLPHGGNKALGNVKPLKDRKIEVIYAGALFAKYSEIQKQDFSKWNFDAEQICRECIDFLLENREVTIEEALEIILKQRDICLSEEELCEFISSCVYIERVVSSYFREEVLRKIAEAGIALTIYGHGWEQCEWLKLSNVSFEGMISPEEVLEKMEDSKVVLNTLPWFKKGSHERIFNGMLHGCVVVSDVSDYLEESLPADTWCSYSLQQEDLEQLPGKIQSLLQNLDYAQQVADAGRKMAMEFHTWQCRAREIHEDLLQYL